MDASGNPWVAGTASVCANAACNIYYAGLAAYRFSGPGWQASGPHNAQPGGFGGGNTGLGAVLDGDSLLAVWRETYNSNTLANDLYVQRWDGNNWTGLGSTSGAVGGNDQFIHPSLLKDGSGNVLLSFKRTTQSGLSSHQTISIYGYIP